MKMLKFAASCALVAVLSVAAAAQKMKAEEVVAKHLDSIGTAEVRASVKNQMAVGDVVFKFISTKNQPAEGRVVMVSEGVKNFLGMNLNAADYATERLIYDGKKASAAFTNATGRSILGDIIKANDFLIEESLLGGALATSWGLSNTATNKAKISFDGTKKIDDKEVYVLDYSPKGGSDLTIKLYFDKETFRHVRSEYKRTSSAGIGSRPEDSSRFRETRITLTENFGDFKAEKGMTLPHSYTINYTISGQNGTSEVEWKFNLSQFAFNQALDAKTFDAETK